MTSKISALFLALALVLTGSLAHAGKYTLTPEQKAEQKRNYLEGRKLFRERIAKNPKLVAQHGARLALGVTKAAGEGWMLGAASAIPVFVVAHSIPGAAVVPDVVAAVSGVAMYNTLEKTIARTNTVKQGLKDGTFSIADGHKMEKGGVILPEWREMVLSDGVGVTAIPAAK